MNRFFCDRKIYCIKFNKYRKLKNSIKSYTSDKTLVLFIICGKYSSKDKEIFKEEKTYLL